MDVSFVHYIVIIIDCFTHFAGTLKMVRNLDDIFIEFKQSQLVITINN
uniref:IstB_IS21 domain-containing protein n=1 Tax=Heterorhabditis bacteriophora TaxID=37862 RepID=A0A1I7W714_HETBA